MIDFWNTDLWKINGNPFWYNIENLMDNIH